MELVSKKVVEHLIAVKSIMKRRGELYNLVNHRGERIEIRISKLKS